MLEFVHITGGSEAGKDIQTRRKVRSQAMRDFRRRQREEREAANKKGQSKASKKTGKSTTTQCPQRERSVSSSSSYHALERPRATSTTSNVTPNFQLDYAASDGLLSAPTFQTPSITLYGDYPSDEMTQSPYFGPQEPQRVRSISLHPTPDFPYRQPSPIPRSPSSWCSETSDPFQSPAQLNQMLAFCESYYHWLQPGIDDDTARVVLSKAMKDAHCPMLLAACCLASVGHLDAIQPDRPGGQYEVYKARVLREVTVRMRSPDTATSNETVGALGLLTSFEMSRGSDEALTHLRGLKSIINMKGGIESFDTRGLPMMLESLDLLHALMFEAPLILTKSSQASPTVEYAQSGIPDAEVFTRLMPLLAAEQNEFQRTTDNAHSRKLQGLFELLSDARTATKGVMTDDSISDCLLRDPIFLSNWSANLEIFRQRSCQDDPEAGDAQYLARACHHCMVLFHNTMSGVPQRHIDNQTHVDGVFTAVRAIKDATWKPIPYLRLLLLLRALVAAKDISKKSFFKAQLVRAMYQMGAREWKRVKNFIMKYLQMTKAMERAPPRASVESDFSSHERSFLTPGHHVSRQPRASTPLSKAAVHLGTPEADNHQSFLTNVQYGIGQPRLGTPPTKSVTLDALYGTPRPSRAPSPYPHTRSLPASQQVTPYLEVDSDPLSSFNPGNAEWLQE